MQAVEKDDVANVNKLLIDANLIYIALRDEHNDEPNIVDASMIDAAKGHEKILDALSYWKTWHPNPIEAPTRPADGSPSSDK